MHAEETSIRQLVANGKYKSALDRAKEFHKAQHSPASQALLIDAYAGRIQSLLSQNLTLEAQCLVDLVRERYPSARERLDELSKTAAARGGALDTLIAPLADPALDRAQKVAIELAIQNNVADLGALAASSALPADHALRKAAAALESAFLAVTSGPVTDEQMDLPEVSRRSPLAPWAILVRAIAWFYRREDERCLDLLDANVLSAIKQDSVPARLVPAMHSMLGRKPATPLSPAARALASKTLEDSTALRKELENLEAALSTDESDNRIFKLVRSAMQECRRSAPGHLKELKRLIYIRCVRVNLDDERLTAALEGLPLLDARLCRSLALDMEAGGSPDNCVMACEDWHHFHRMAVAEGWFAAGGVETAAVYLHMAGVLNKIPRPRLIKFQEMARKETKEAYFLNPDQLYVRACSIDPHRDAFAQWHRWASGIAVAEAEAVAKTWNKVRPTDIEPLLYLMREASKRSAYPTALGYLDKAERIDAVNSEVRAARLRLLAANALRHLRQKKPHLAAEKLAVIAQLPQSRQGDRPAFIEAIRFLIGLAQGDNGNERTQAELSRLLGSDMAAGMLVSSLAKVVKGGYRVQLPDPPSLGTAHRQALPATIARLTDLALDLGIENFTMPMGYMRAATQQFPAVKQLLTLDQLAGLADAALTEGHDPFAYAISEAGLNREKSLPGPSSARFLLLRARSLPQKSAERFEACVTAAADLARASQDVYTLNLAAALLDEEYSLGMEPLSLKPGQAVEVLRREAAASGSWGGTRNEPKYNDLFPDRLCDCQDCRRARGELPPWFDDDDDLDADNPSNAEKEFIEFMKETVLNLQTGKGKKRKAK